MTNTPDGPAPTPDMPDPRIERLVAVAREHAAAEGRGDMEATLATLEANPVYELQPMGRTFAGLAAARLCYEHFFAEFMPLDTSAEMKNEWLTDEGLGQEYVIDLRWPDGSSERHNVIGILLFGNERLSGERIYASERLFHLMYGPGFDASVPIDTSNQG